MPAKASERKATSKAGLTVLFDKEERQLIRRAAVESESRSSGQFIREAAIRAAKKVLAA